MNSHNLYRLFFLLYSLCFAACEGDVSCFEVKSVDRIDIENLISDESWNFANAINEFDMPWDKRPGQATIFKSLRDRNNLYVIFYSVDSSITVLNEICEEADISREDRVEIFFSNCKTLDKYYCIEVDPYGRVLDYKAQFYRNFDRNWNMEHLVVDSEITTDGYNIALAIPLQQLKNHMKIDVTDEFYVGLFRADLQYFEKHLQENWISWVNPLTKDPDFHISEAFGVFCFSEE